VKQIIEQWNQDLESHVRSFMEQAREVRKWDEQVLDTSSKVHQSDQGALSHTYMHRAACIWGGAYASEC